MLIIIRHSDDESDGCTDNHDCQLATNGKHLARKVGRKLIKEHGLPDIIFVSPFLRTLQTMRYMLDGLDTSSIKIVEDVRLSRYFFDRDKANPIISPKTKSKNIPIDETYREFKARVRDFIEDMNYHNKNVWVITHVVVYKQICRHYQHDVHGHIPFMTHKKFKYCKGCDTYH